MNANPDGLLALQTQVAAFFASAREQARDGLTWVEFGRLLVQLLYLSVSALDAVATLSGPQKREIVLVAAASLFDTLADKAVPPTAWPAWLLVRPATRVLVISLAAGAIEALLKISRSVSA